MKRERRVPTAGGGDDQPERAEECEQAEVSPSGDDQVNSAMLAVLTFSIKRGEAV